MCLQSQSMPRATVVESQSSESAGVGDLRLVPSISAQSLGSRQVARSTWSKPLASSIFVGVNPCHSTDTLMHWSVEKLSSRSVSRNFSMEKYAKASPINISSYNMRGIHGMESTYSLLRLT